MSISDRIQKLTSDLTKVAAIQGICLPMALALDDEDLISLEIQERFSLLVTVLFIVAVIFGLWLLEKALRYIHKYYKINNLSSIWIKNIFMCNCNTQFRLPCKKTISAIQKIYLSKKKKIFEGLDLEFEPRYCFDYNNIN